eukprot:3151640-Prymnesium_polylepis.1
MESSSNGNSAHTVYPKHCAQNNGEILQHNQAGRRHQRGAADPFTAAHTRLRLPRLRQGWRARGQARREHPGGPRAARARALPAAAHCHHGGGVDLGRHGAVRHQPGAPGLARR